MRPHDRAGRLAGEVADDPVGALDLVEDPGGDAAEEGGLEGVEVGGRCDGGSGRGRIGRSASESVERMGDERERVVGLLRARAPELQAQGVRGLALFGSVARGEARADSDVDLLVELDQDTKLGFRVVGLQDDLRRLLGREVGLTFAGQLRAEFGERIARDLVWVFE